MYSNENWENLSPANSTKMDFKEMLLEIEHYIKESVFNKI